MKKTEHKPSMLQQKLILYVTDKNSIDTMHAKIWCIHFKDCWKNRELEKESHQDLGFKLLKPIKKTEQKLDFCSL